MLSFRRHFPHIFHRCLYYNLCNHINIDSANNEEFEKETKSAENYGYAPDTIDIISHSHLDFINAKQRKKIDKMEEEISIYLESGFQVYEFDKVPIWNPSTLFQVGHRNQFHEFAASNIFKLFETFLFPNTLKTQWTIPKAMKNDLRLQNIESIIDYYPFQHTLSENNNKAFIESSSKKTKKSSKKQSHWKQVENAKYGNLKDSFGSNMPFLVNDDREILIWRDAHDAICNMHKIERVIEEYEPDIIVIEGVCDETTMKIYGKTSFNLYLSSVKNIFSRMISQSESNRMRQEKFGRAMFGISDALCVRQGQIQSGAFVMHGVVKFMMDNSEKMKMPQLIFGDLSLDICGVFMLIARYLDTFQLPMLRELLRQFGDDEMYKNVSNDVNFEQIFGKLYQNIDEYATLIHVLMQFLAPHSLVVANYRNHFLSLAINEAVMAKNDKCKVLAIMGQGHVNDLIFKMENMNKQKDVLVNPFKDVSHNQVTLKSNIPIVSRDCFEKELNQNEIDFVLNEFGQNILNLFQHKLDTEKLKVFD